MDSITSELIRREILRLLHKRGEDKSICPSEVARSLCPEAWRPLMEPVRAVAIQLVAQGQIEILQKGQRIDPSTIKGPIRLSMRSRA